LQNFWFLDFLTLVELSGLLRLFDIDTTVSITGGIDRTSGTETTGEMTDIQLLNSTQ